MGERVSFASNGHTCDGYLARPATGKGPAVVVIQEWWGLVPHVEDLVDRFAGAGFLALAPDLYHGVKTTSPDTATKLLMELDVERAGREIAGAGAHLLADPASATSRYGVVGFCMGGALAQYAACEDRRVGAAVSFYGGFKKVPLRWDGLSGPLLLFYGGADTGVPASQAAPLEETLRALGKKVETVVYPGAAHAFFNDTRPEVHDAAASADAWRRTIAHFRAHLA